MAPGKSPKKWHTKKKILIIGAGASGLTSIKGCKEEGNKLEVVCYEKYGELGGLWRYYSPDEGVQCIVKPTISNTSKEMSSFSDFPAPTHFPTFMHHTDVLKYLELYAEFFDLLRHIRFNQKVVDVSPSEDYDISGKWQVKVQDLKTNEKRIETYDGVMLCVGHHLFPFIPPFPNHDIYKGKIVHSHNCKTSTGMENRSVLVIGPGNSGVDLAAELSGIASKVYLSTRRANFFIPRLSKKSKPVDLFLNRRSNVLTSSKYASKNVEKIINNRLDPKRLRIKRHHSPVSLHPAITDEMKAKLLTGRVNIKHNVKQFTENGVIFDREEQVTPVDVIVFATGYKFKFPFLKEKIIRIGKDNKVELYKYMFPPRLRHQTLAVIGLIEPSGPLFPVFEMQARWYVALMIGRCRLPEKEKMVKDVKSTEGFRAKRYVQLAGDSVESPWLQYMDEIAENIGAEPQMFGFFGCETQLHWACFFGPCLPYQYRLFGPHKWSGARHEIMDYNTRMREHCADKEDLENTSFNHN